MIEDRRRQKLKEVFDDFDRVGLGIPVPWYEQFKKEKEVEEREYNRLGNTLKECLHCNGEAFLKEEWNHEYPVGIYVQCKSCGMRTPQFVEFEPVDMQRRKYSLILSTKKAIELWNRRKDVK
jgi:transcription elongation factor Elf1